MASFLEKKINKNKIVEKIEILWFRPTTSKPKFKVFEKIELKLRLSGKTLSHTNSVSLDSTITHLTYDRRQREFQKITITTHRAFKQLCAPTF